MFEMHPDGVDEARKRMNAAKPRRVQDRGPLWSRKTGAGSPHRSPVTTGDDAVGQIQN